jgi:hypothetical protein
MTKPWKIFADCTADNMRTVCQKRRAPAMTLEQERLIDVLLSAFETSHARCPYGPAMQAEYAAIAALRADHTRLKGIVDRIVELIGSTTSKPANLADDTLLRRVARIATGKDGA